VIVAERLKAALQAAGISQSELARRVGVSQPTIYRATHGKLYGTRYLHRIARELGTTPAYLSGETDDPLGEAPDAAPLTFDQRRLLDCFTALPPAPQQALLTIAITMAGQST
jgi:transcriptional regulator with XRE-family HTH domain